MAAFLRRWRDWLRPLAWGLVALGEALVLLWALRPARPLPPATALPKAPEVWVWDGGRLRAVPATATIPANLLARLGVRLYPGDRVRCDGRVVAAAEPRAWRAGQTLQVERAAVVHLYAPRDERRVSTTAATLGEAAWDAGMRWRPTDAWAPASTTPIAWGHAARLQRARRVRVTTPQGELAFWARADTVGEALVQGGLAVEGLDRTDPSPEAPLPEDESPVKVTRVREEILLEQRPLAFEVRYQPVPDLEIDHLQTVQEGALGLEVRRVRVRYENGREVSRQAEASWVARKPRDRIIGYGTKIVIRTLDTPDGPIRYWRAVRVYATSYSPCRLGVDYCNDITASGLPLHKGVVGVKRAWFYAMSGQRIYVPGYGIGVIGDTGGGLPDRHWVDLGYDDDNYVSWHQWVTMYFLAPPPPPEQILWILP